MKKEREQRKSIFPYFEVLGGDDGLVDMGEMRVDKIALTIEDWQGHEIAFGAEGLRNQVLIIDSGILGTDFDDLIYLTEKFCEKNDIVDREMFLSRLAGIYDEMNNIVRAGSGRLLVIDAGRFNGNRVVMFSEVDGEILKWQPKPDKRYTKGWRFEPVDLVADCEKVLVYLDGYRGNQLTVTGICDE
jgi:hypothetical protein